MLDIGIIIPELTKYGGAERLLIECVARWQYRHRITLYASKFDESILKEHEVDPTVNLVPISPHFRDAHSIVLNAVLLPKIWEQEIGRHDVYHAHLWPCHLIDRHPMVWYPHEPLRILSDLRFEETIPDRLGSTRNIHIYPKYNYDGVSVAYREAYLNAIDLFDKLGRPDCIVANSKYSAAYLGEVYGIETPEVVYPGVNVGDFIYPLTPAAVRSSGIGSTARSASQSMVDENVFLTVGQLWRHKRIGLAIEALKMVERAQLYVVGHGPELSNLRRMAESLGVDDRVFFLSGLTNHELRILYGRALAVVFTPIKEPFGIVALEAMAAGRPLIAVDEGGFIEVVDETCAFLVKPEPSLIAQKMEFLRDNRDVAAEMGRAGRELVKEYTWDRTAGELMDRIEKTHSRWAASRKSVPASRWESDTTLFGIQYYCWYGEGLGSTHWNDNPIHGTVTDMPMRGYYGSNFASTIRGHFEQLEGAGIDFLILNLHLDACGLNARESATIDHVFSLANSMNSSLRFAVQLCIQEGALESVSDAMEVIRRRYCRNSHYLGLNEKPVLYIFWTGVHDGIRSRIRLLKDATDGMVRIASSLRLYDPQTEPAKTMGLFDGFSLYSPLELSGSESRGKVWACAYQSNDAGAMGLRIVTCSPGYDDLHLLDSERSRYTRAGVARNNGATYASTIDFALSLNPRPDQVLISTWNEYHENTHIEPSVKYGSLYLDMTETFIRSAKELWSKGTERR